MNNRLTLTLVLLAGGATMAQASEVTIGDYDFDLGQFANAAVTYRAPGDPQNGGQNGHVTFDGKLWDNTVGVDGVTIGELAAGQYGSDPGDQLSLNDRSTPDWFTLNFALGLTLGDSAHDTFVFYEITSSLAPTASATGIDVEGTSWEVSFDGGATFINAALGTTTFLDFSGVGVENVNQIAFDLTAFGFSEGDTLTSVTVRNIDSGSGTSDPDFIFGGLEGNMAVVPLPPAALAGLGMLAGCLGVRKLRQR